jgi:hypothetical protein
MPTKKRGLRLYIRIPRTGKHRTNEYKKKLTPSVSINLYSLFALLHFAGFGMQ